MHNNLAQRWFAALLLAIALGAAAGCGKVEPPRFHSNLVQMAAKNVTVDHQKEVADILDAMYGTPDDPFVLPESGLDLKKIQLAAGPVWSDRRGSKRGLYREHCAHCHGITGDALGPTAQFLKPYPRDYRQGWYKFKSTPSNLPPTHADLMRTLNDGVAGTAMPSFKLLPKAEVEALAEYVKYLSLRGQTELALIAFIGEYVDAGKPIPTDSDTLVGEVLEPVASKWKGAAGQTTPVPPPPADFGTVASVDKGKQLFYTIGGCTKCHGPTALGDGQLVLDEWSKEIDLLKKRVTDGERRLATDVALEGEERAQAAQQIENLEHALEVAALPLRENQPRNLRQGIFRGGREPYEIFYKLHNGIFASQMPGIAQTPMMTPDGIWHIVDYVLALPYQPGSQFFHSETVAPPRERL